MAEPTLNHQPEAAFKQSLLCKETHSISRFFLRDFGELVCYLLRVKQAAARANADSGHITDAQAQAIFSACANLQKSSDSEIFMVDVLQGGGGFAINGNINEAILFELARFDTRTPITIKDINKSQSSADVCASALRLSLYHMCQNLERAIDELTSEIGHFVEQWGSIKTLARTCWQDALVISMGERFSGIVHGFSLCYQEVSDKMQNLLYLPLGTTVLGTAAGATSSYRELVLLHLSEILDRKILPTANAVSSAQNFPDLALLANAIKLVAENLIRFGLDLRLLNSGPRGGLSEIALPRIM
ncbi:MAG TPA: lyase family protein, partial [Myxococcota bacterium]|nr:lyase family protein [Myxococcota bacterium]